MLGFVLSIYANSEAQKIIRRVNAYILIDTDAGIGKIGDDVRIRRASSEGAVTVGTARLVKFQDGKAAARIIEEARSYVIGIGDFVESAKIEEVSKVADNVQTDDKAMYVIFRVVSGYALIDGDTGFGRINDVVQVRRRSEGGVMDVGSVRLVKAKNGMMAAKIVDEAPSSKIRVGDFIVHRMTEVDIDTYFFEGFRRN